MHLADTNPESANIMLMGKGGCVPLSGVKYGKGSAVANNYVGKALELARQRYDIARVVIAADWDLYYRGRGDNVTKFRAKNGGFQVLLNKLHHDIRKFTELGKTVFLVLNIPVGKTFFPSWRIQRDLRHFPQVFQRREGGLTRRALDERLGKMQAELERVGRLAGARIINPVNFLCDARYCPSADQSGRPMYKDGNHLNLYWVRDNARFMDETVLPSRPQ
jgi:hypothetical protein